MSVLVVSNACFDKDSDEVFDKGEFPDADNVQTPGHTLLACATVAGNRERKISNPGVDSTAACPAKHQQPVAKTSA